MSLQLLTWVLLGSVLGQTGTPIVQESSKEKPPTLNEALQGKLKEFFTALGALEDSNLVVELGTLMELPYRSPRFPIGKSGLHALAFSLGSRASVSDKHIIFTLTGNRGDTRRLNQSQSFADWVRTMPKEQREQLVRKNVAFADLSHHHAETLLSIHGRMGFAQFIVKNPPISTTLVRGTFGVYTPGTTTRKIGIGSEAAYELKDGETAPDWTTEDRGESPSRRKSNGSLRFGDGEILSLGRANQRAYDALGVRYEVDPSLESGLFFFRGDYDENDWDEVLKSIGQADPIKKSVRPLSGDIDGILELLLPEWQAKLGSNIDLPTLLAGLRVTTAEAKRLLPGAPPSTWQSRRETDQVIIRPTISWIVEAPGSRVMPGSDGIIRNLSLVVIELGG